MGVWYSCTLKQLQQCSARDIANSLWALAELAASPPAQFVEALLVAISHKSQINTQDLANVLWSLGALGVSVDGKQAGRPQDDSSTGYQRSQPPKVSDVVEGEEERPPPGAAIRMQLHEQQLGSTGLNAAALSPSSDGRASAPAPYVVQRRSGGGHQPHQLRRVMQQLLSVAGHMLPAFKPQELSNLLWGCACIRYQPAASFMQHFTLVVRNQWLSLSPQHLGNIAWAMAKLHYVPDAAWLASLLKHSGRLLPYFSPADFSQLAYALACWCVHSPSWGSDTRQPSPHAHAQTSSSSREQVNGPASTSQPAGPAALHHAYPPRQQGRQPRSTRVEHRPDAGVAANSSGSQQLRTPAATLRPYAVSEMHRDDADAQRLRQSSGSAQAAAPSSSGQVSIYLADADIRQGVGRWLGGFYATSLPKLSAFNAQELANTLWALSWLQRAITSLHYQTPPPADVPEPEFPHSDGPQASDEAGALTSYDDDAPAGVPIAYASTSCSGGQREVSWRPPVLWQVGFEAAVEQQLPEFSPQGVAEVLACSVHLKV